MAEKIRGITVEIGGETVGLQNALKDVNKRSRELQNELKQVERALRFDPGNTTLLAQQQQILTEQVANTTEKLNRLKEAQSQVEQQFQNGEIGADQYRAFQRELVTTESRLNDLRNALRNVDNGSSVNAVQADLANVSNEANEAQGAVKELGGELAGLIGGLAAGGGLAGAISTALDMSSLDTKIEIQFDVPESSKQTIKDAVKGIEAYGVDAEAALEGVRRQWALNKDAADAVNNMVVRGAGAIAAAFSGVDFTELIQETNEIASSLKISNEEALALVDALLKAGFPPEQLDTIAEYGLQMKNAGFNLTEIQAIFEAGIDTKSWNIDNLLDGVKETRIRMAEFGESIPKAVTDLLDGTGVNSKKISEWGQAVAEGGEKGSKALSDMVTWLSGIEDKAVQNAIATQLMGTMWEDQGGNLISVFQGVSTAVDKTTENTNGLYETMGKVNADPAIELQHAFNQLKEALQPLLLQIAEIVSKIANWIAENPKLAATITAIVTGLGVLLGALMALGPLITGLIGAATALGISVGALVGIVAGVVVGIAALIAAGVLLYKNWDVIKAKAIEIWGNVKSTFSSVTSAIAGFIKKNFGDGVYGAVQKYMEMAKTIIVSILGFWKGTFSNTLSFLKSLVTGDFEGMKNAISEQMENVKSTIKKIWGSIEDFFSNIDLKQIGKDIISGLINGIGDMFPGLKAKVEELASNIPEWAKKMLGIHSPSRVMMEVGRWTGEGLAVGLENSRKTVQKSTTNIVDDLVALNGRIATEMKKNKAKQQEITASQIESSKNWFEKKKYYNQLSLTDELKYFDYMAKLAKNNIQERAQAEREVFRVKKEINSQLTAVNTQYVQKMEDANKRLADSEKALTDQYKQALESRTKSLMSFTGIFDKVKESSGVTGQDLIDNLRGQVSTFSDWANNISSLSAKGIDQGLLEDLREMGPAAYSEIAALNSLTAGQLAEYSRLWQEKNRLARTQATSELEGLKLDTSNKIKELRVQTAQELVGYKNEWIEKIKEIRTGTSDEFVKMNTSMKDIGKNSIQGLMDGMKEMTGPLAAQAKAIADSISKTIKSALQIKSPSRVMMTLGEFVGEGLWRGMDNTIPDINSMANRLAAASIPEINRSNYNLKTNNGSSVLDGNSNSYGDIHITIPAKDIKEFADVTDFFNRLPQVIKQY